MSLAEVHSSFTVQSFKDHTLIARLDTLSHPADPQEVIIFKGL